MTNRSMQRSPRSTLLLLFLAALFMAANPAAAETLRMAIHDSPWWPAYEKVIEEYERQTGNTVEIFQYPHATLYEKQVASARQGTDLFDIVHFDDAWAPFFMGGGYLAPVEEIDRGFELDPNIIEYGWSGRWSDEADYTTEDGTLYGIPVNGNIQLFFYNGDAYAEAGLSAPETWEEVRHAAETLHSRSLFGYATITVADIQAVYFWMPILRSFGGGVFADPPNDWTVTVSDCNSLASLEWILGMREFSPPGIGNTGQQDVLSYLSNGQLAQAVNVSAVFPFMDDPNFAAFPGLIEFAPVPAHSETGERSSTIGNWVAGIPKTSPNKELALDFLRFITSKEMQVLTGEFGGVPVRIDAYEELAAREDHEFRFFRAYLDTFEYAESRPRIEQWPEIVSALGANFQKAMVNELSAQEAVDVMAKDVVRIMTTAGYDTRVSGCDN
jgi:multiple sugar transport system substrate-binding protein